MKAWIAAAACCALPMGAMAQRVSGAVLAEGQPIPLSGTVVTTINSAGSTLARTLTNRDGRYSLAIEPGAVRIRAVRIGYRPAVVDIPRGAGDVTLDLTMVRAPVILETVRVTVDASCRTSGEGQFARELWEQARSALLAAIVAREANPAQVQLLEYSRRMDRTRRLVSQQEIRTTFGQSTRPVSTARSATQLAAEGYRGRDPVTGGDMYFGPDADVLFDPAFEATHCFGLSRGAGNRAGQVGLTFKPRDNKRDFVDVSGVLWLNPQTPELLQLDYQYTGVDPEVVRAGAGGTLHFRTMANGIVLIDSWSILVPTVTEVRQRGFDGVPTSRAVINDLAETGGYVADATWADGVRWAATLGALRGRIRDKGGEGVPDVVVSAGGAESPTNNLGGYSIHPLPPGRYSVAILDSAYAGFLPPVRQSREVVVTTGDTTIADFEVPSRSSRIDDICRGQSRGGNTLVLLGRIGDGSGAIPQKLAVQVDWYESSSASDEVDLSKIKHMVRNAEVNSAGAFLVCGVPHLSSHISLRARIGSATIADTSLMSANREGLRVSATRKLEWSLPTGAFESALKGDAAALSGRVLRDGKPVADAEVWMVFADTMVRTDSAGRFRVGGLRAGAHMVQIRRIGYAVVRDTALLRPREETVRDFTMGALELDTMRTVGKGRAYDVPRLQDFERRRLSGMGGHFISEDELRQHEGRSVADVIRTFVPGVTLEAFRGQLFLKSTSGMQRINGSSSCWATVYLDGMLLYGGEPGVTPPDMKQFLGAALSGVEYYGSASSLPLQFKSTKNACGTVLLWTRGK